MKHDTRQHDAIVLAIDEPALGVGAELLRVCETDWPLLMVEHAGEALRYVRQFDPPVLFVCVGHHGDGVEIAVTVIAELHARIHRPNRPLVAMTAFHDERIEQSIRIAGASLHFALGSESDRVQLREALQELGITPLVAAPHSGLSPPRSRASPHASRSPRTRRSSLH